MPNFLPEIDDASAILFLITDVDGVGSLTSAIASRAENQQKNGFEIIGLRDLSAQDFNELPVNVDRIHEIIQKFKKALQISGSGNTQKIDLFFAVMTIEAWMLAFTGAISKWAKIPEENVLQILSSFNLEEIKSPSNILKQIATTSSRKNPKSFHEVMSLVSYITDFEINNVYESNKIPNFNKFWDRLISLSDSGHLSTAFPPYSA